MKRLKIGDTSPKGSRRFKGISKYVGSLRKQHCGIVARGVK